MYDTPGKRPGLRAGRSGMGEDDANGGPGIARLKPRATLSHG